jgi:hypothetical protein
VKKIGLTALLLMGMFAFVVLPGSPASAESACVNHALTIGSTVVLLGDDVLIDESAWNCGSGLGLRVHVRQVVVGPNDSWELGPVTTFLGYRDVATFFTPTEVGHYTVKAWIYTMSNCLVATDSSGFDVTA